MMAKFLLFTVLCASLLVSNYAEELLDIESLENEVEDRLQRVKAIAEKIRNSTQIYDEMTEERISTINYMYHSMMENIKKTINEAAIEGVKHRRWFINFECLVGSANEAATNLKNTFGNFPEDMKKRKEKALAAVLPYRVIGDNLQTYTKEMYEAKKKEMSSTKDPVAVKKILTEMAANLKTVDGVLVDLENKIFKLKFNFFEPFVNICYIVEFALRIIPTRDFPKLLKCMVW